MKILLSAYSCEPGKGSERGVGWNVVREAARYHKVWVLTRPDESREAIEAELQQHPIPNLHFVYFTLPFWQDSLRWGQSGAMQLHYYFWQIQAYFVARRLHREIEFDIIHHVTFVKYSSPSFLSLLPTPFIWGPVGGAESAPKPFWQDFNLKNRLYEILRSAWRWVGEHDPFTRLTARCSAVAYATTEDTAQRLRQMGAANVQIYSALGLSQEELTQLQQCSPPHQSPVRFISIARLLHWKGFHLGLRAFAEANLPDAEYWILGDGPERDRLQDLASELGIIQQVKFLGELSREDVLLKLEQSSCLVHPSLHDSGGLVCLEAMAAGRPVICLNLGGPAEQVTSQTGLKIAADNPDQSVAGLAEAMIQIAQDGNLRQQLGQAGQLRVQENYSWNSKGKHLAQLYEAIALQKNDDSSHLNKDSISSDNEQIK
jgi:glycosyltransferase involved in cell wall biosynthesis